MSTTTHQEVTVVNVVTVERRSSKPATPLVAGIPSLRAKSGWSAVVDLVEQDIELQLSRLDGETEWAVDAMYRRSTSFPFWCHGWAARFCLLQRPAAEIAVALDAAIAEKAAVA